MIHKLIKNNIAPVLVITSIQFIFFHQIEIINPLNHGWFVHSGDVFSMFIAQIYYLQQNVNDFFPLGSLINYAGEWCGNLIKFEVPITLFSKIIYEIFLVLRINIPPNFQLYGIFIFLNMYLLNLFLLKILNIFNKDLNTYIKLINFIGVLIVSSSPYILFRNLIFHFNVGSYWVVAATLYLFLNRQYKFSHWLALIAISAFIHPYLTIFPAISWLIYVILSGFEFENSIGDYWRKIFWQSLLIGVSILAPIIIISGPWIGTGNLAASGLGELHANLLSLFDSNGRSEFVSDVKTLNGKRGDSEGFGFIGAGSIFLLCISIFLFFTNENIRKKVSSPKNFKFIPLFAIFLLLSTGGVFAFGDHLLFKINFSGIFYKVYATFRSSGRYIALCAMLVQILSIALVIKYVDKKYASIILCLSFFIQIYDEKSLIIDLRLRDAAIYIQKDSQSLGRINWDKVSKVDFILPEDSHYIWKMDVIYRAALKNIPTNDSFCARPNDLVLNKLRDEMKSKFSKAENFDPLVLYALYPSLLLEIIPPIGWSVMKLEDGSTLLVSKDLLAPYENLR